jgi:hypothetical protein
LVLLESSTPLLSSVFTRHPNVSCLFQLIARTRFHLKMKQLIPASLENGNVDKQKEVPADTSTQSVVAYFSFALCLSTVSTSENGSSSFALKSKTSEKPLLVDCVDLLLPVAAVRRVDNR